MDTKIYNKILTLPLSGNMQTTLQYTLNNYGKQGYRLIDCHSTDSALVVFLKKEYKVEYVPTSKHSKSQHNNPINLGNEENELEDMNWD